MSRTKYIYCWFDQRYNAIKVGHSVEPGFRYLQYMAFANLDPMHGSMRMYPSADRKDADEIEGQIMKLLRSIGLRNVPNSHLRGSALNELFCLNGFTYSTIAELVINYAERSEAWLLAEQYEAWERAEQERAEEELAQAETYWRLGIGVAGYTWPLEWGDAP